MIHPSSTMMLLQLDNIILIFICVVQIQCCNQPAAPKIDEPPSSQTVSIGQNGTFNCTGVGDSVDWFIDNLNTNTSLAQDTVITVIEENCTLTSQLVLIGNNFTKNTSIYCAISSNGNGSINSKTVQLTVRGSISDKVTRILPNDVRTSTTPITNSAMPATLSASINFVPTSIFPNSCNIISIATTVTNTIIQNNINHNIVLYCVVVFGITVILHLIIIGVLLMIRLKLRCIHKSNTRVAQVSANNMNINLNYESWDGFELNSTRRKLEYRTIGTTCHNQQNDTILTEQNNNEIYEEASDSNNKTNDSISSSDKSNQVVIENDTPLYATVHKDRVRSDGCFETKSVDVDDDSSLNTN